jgi:hypothetical protein
MWYTKSGRADMDHVLNYMEENGIPITRGNYIGLNWMGEYDPDKPLPAELEAELPPALQIQDEEEEEKE